MRQAVLLLFLGVAACAPHAPPGMAFAAGPGEGVRVVFPRSACSGSEVVVLLTQRGTFVGAVGPGEATTLAIPEGTRHLVAIAKVDVLAPPHLYFNRAVVDVPAPPAGLLFDSRRRDARQCGMLYYADVHVATAEELDQALAGTEVKWLEPHPAEGQAWLDEHKERVTELLAPRPQR